MEPSEEEIGTKNKLVALGCTDGTLRVFGLSSGKEYLKSKVKFNFDMISCFIVCLRQGCSIFIQMLLLPNNELF